MDFIKKNLKTILCVIALISLFLPIATFTIESYGYSEAISLNGIDISTERFIGFLLILCPVLLILSNYISKIKPYENIISIIAPILCIVVLIYIYAQSSAVFEKTCVASMDAVGDIFEYTDDYFDDDYFDDDYLDFADNTSMDSSIGIGTILAMLSYVILEIIALKDNPTLVNNITSNAKTKLSSIQDKAGETSNKNTSQTDDLKKYKEMLDAGIITQEEFDLKKKQILGL